MRRILTTLFVGVLAAACAGDDGSGVAPSSVGQPTVTTVARPVSTTRPTVGAEQGADQLADLIGLAVETVVSTDFPIAMVAAVGDHPALVGQRSGVVRELSAGELGDVVLDLSAMVSTEGEGGLLSLARHPDVSERIFVHYTDRSGDTVVSEFPAVGPNTDERKLLEIDQPARNHNGGMIQFGPDAGLYIGLGDGGGGGDRFGNGQNRDTLLGGIVRLDVDTTESVLWQYGLRNPWRFWIDGDNIWIADVGQNAFEEVNLAPVTEPDINYGWPILEGVHCFRTETCDQDGLEPPLVEVAHGDGGTCSITGGVVYRGAEIPEMQGRFFFSDLCGRYLRSVDEHGNLIDHQLGLDSSVVSFGVDEADEMYVLTTDAILKVVPVR